MRKNDPMLFCGFCGDSQYRVQKMIVGKNNVCICNGCAELCANMGQEKSKENEEEPFLPIIVSDDIAAHFDRIGVLRNNAITLMTDCYAESRVVWENIQEKYNVGEGIMYDCKTKTLKKSAEQQEVNDWFYANFMVIEEGNDGGSV